MYCFYKESLLPDKELSTLDNQIQRRRAQGKIIYEILLGEELSMKSFCHSRFQSYLNFRLLSFY